MWSDNETNLDLLGYTHLVGAVLGIVREDRLLPASIGVFGDWGSGKSSLIQMVRAELEKDADTLVITFNGWLFEGYEDAKTALMGSIIDELAERKTLSVKGKELFLRLVGRINVMRIAGTASRVAMGYALAGVPGALAGTAPDLAKAGADLVESAKNVSPADIGRFVRENDPGQQLRRGVREFRDDFAELLGDTKVKRLVIIVDDLDRCAPDTIIETLEAIKLFLFVPKTAFIIGADERLIQYAVRRRFPELPGERADVGRDYLEKLVQFPIRIPPMGRGETETYIKLLLAERCVLGTEPYERIRKAGVVADSRLDVRLDREAVSAAIGSQPAKDLDEAIALGDRIGPVLAAGLSGNPRQCKRFLNSLMMRLQMATSRRVDLKRRVLAKLMLLEYLRPESFKELARLQAGQAGRPRELAAAEGGSSSPVSEGERGANDPSPAPKVAPVTADAATGSVFTNWNADNWLSDWLASDPKLADEDLGPYFYFAREKLESFSGAALRMSPRAQETVAKILGSVEAERTLVLNRAGGLSPVDAAAVFEELGARARETETPTAVDSPLAFMCDFVERRPELFGEFMIFMKSLPHAAMPFALIPRLENLSSTTVERRQQFLPLLEMWSSSGHAPLRKAAAARLAKVSR